MKKQINFLKIVSFLILTLIISCDNDDPSPEIINTDISVTTSIQNFGWITTNDLEIKLQTALTYNYGNVLENELEKKLTFNSDTTRVIATINFKQNYSTKYFDQNIENNTVIIDLKRSFSVNIEDVFSQNYTIATSPWQHCNITYSFINYTSDITEQEQINAFASATQTWANTIDNLSFENIGFNNSNADIRILFTQNHHHPPCTTSFTNIDLAHAYFPIDDTYTGSEGDIHFNDNKNFTNNLIFHEWDFETIAVHELGHSLGINHSTQSDAIMYNTIEKFNRKTQLTQDDIDAIIDLYDASNCTNNIGESEININQNNWTFENTQINTTSSQKQFTITNTGSTNFNITNITSNNSVFEIVSGQSGVVTPSNSISFNVTFNPTNTQTYNGVITVENTADNANSSNSTIQVTGVGVDTGNSSISLSGNLNFNDVNVGSSDTRTFTINNNGNQSFNVSSINFPSSVYSANWNSGTINGGGSQMVTVTFQPNNEQSFNGTVTVNNNADTGSNTISISGTGTVSDTKIIALSGNLNYGSVSVGATSNKILRISNNGNSILNVSGISVPTGYSVIGSQNFNVSAGGYVDRTIRFSPQNTANYNGAINVASNATSGINTISISGSGETASTRIIQLTGSLNFGNVNVGSSLDRTLYIKNIGNSTLTVSGINMPNDFQIFGPQSFTIAQGLTVTRTIRFSPQNATNYNDVITINSDATSGSNSINVSGTGVGAAQTRVINLSGNTNFGTVAIGSSVDRTLTISNSGNSTLTVTDFDMPTDFTVIGSESFIVSAGGSVNRIIRFSPQSIMSYATTMFVNSNKTSGLHSKTLQGTGVGSTATYSITPPEDQYTNCPSNNHTCGGSTYQGSTIKMSIVAAEEDYIYFKIKKCDNSSFTQSGTAYLKEDNVCGSTVRTINYSAGSSYVQLSIPNTLSSGETRVYRGVIIASDNFKAFTYDILITKD